MSTNIDIDRSIAPHLQAGDPHTYSCLTRNPNRIWTIKPCGSDAWSVRMDDITNQEWFASKCGFTLLGVAGALHLWGLAGPVEWRAKLQTDESVGA